MSIYGTTDPLIDHAVRVIKATYGDDVSIDAKDKDLLKFGRNRLCNTSKTTLMTLPTGIDNETYVASNLITTISSSSSSDTEIVTVEGHTLSGGNFTFVTQSATLNGQNQVTLGTALARVSRVINTGSNDLVGNIYVYENDTTTAGVPDTDTLVHLIVEAGLNNSEKGATTISSTDYWIITGFYADCLEKTSAYGIIHFEVREYGGVFINKIDKSASDSHELSHEFKPYLIVPANADVRLRCSASAVNKDFSGGIQGVLAKVV